MTYEEWIKFSKEMVKKAQVPSPADTHLSFEIEKAYWKGYYDAAKDSARWVKE